MVNQRRFDVFIPLHDFAWDGDTFEFGPGLCLKRLASTSFLDRFAKGLTPLELASLPDQVSHWLTFESNSRGHSSGALANLLMLSLWLAKSTKTHVAFRFKVGKDETTNETGIARLFDCFQYVEGSTHAKFEDADLRQAGAFFAALLDIPADTRLFMGQILTLNGCWQSHWHAAIALFASATETLLTYSEAQGLTKRLAVAYACLLHNDKNDRDAAYAEFRECYKTRSDIVHGRSLSVPKIERLAKVVRWQNLLRSLWGRILRDPDLVAMLNGDDVQRAGHITPMVKGYTPPP